MYALPHVCPVWSTYSHDYFCNDWLCMALNLKRASVRFDQVLLVTIIYYLPLSLETPDVLEMLYLFVSYTDKNSCYC